MKKHKSGRFKKGEIPWHKGQKNVYSDEALEKMSLAKQGYKMNWKGGRMIDKDGYILIYSPDHPFRNRHKYMREHRLIMENYLGRFLEPFEIIHHRNGVKRDNRIENLLLLTQREHAILHLKKRYAKKK